MLYIHLKSIFPELSLAGSINTLEVIKYVGILYVYNVDVTTNGDAENNFCSLSSILHSCCLQIYFAACRPALSTSRALQANGERRVGNLLCFFNCSRRENGYSSGFS